MPARDSADPAGFGAAFTALLAAAGFTVDGVLGALPEDRRGRVSRSMLYDWKKGQHLPLDATGPLLEVVQVCLAAAGERGASLVSPGSEDGWRPLLAEARQARDADIARGRRTSGGEPGSAWSGGRSASGIRSKWGCLFGTRLCVWACGRAEAAACAPADGGAWPRCISRYQMPSDMCGHRRGPGPLPVEPGQDSARRP